MTRRTVERENGFSYNYTDLNSHVFPPKRECIKDAMVWEDLDGDGCIDFICIGTESGDYEDDDHEVVAIHTPTGNRIWTALKGEASKKLSLINGVVVVSTNESNQLRGLDPRTGQQLWQVALDDELNEDNFDGADAAPTIAPLGGPWAGFECIDDMTYILDVRNGQIVKSVEGQLRPHAWNLPGLVALKTENSDGEDVIDIFDLTQGRSIYQMEDGSAVTVYGGGFYGFLHAGYNAEGSYGTKLSMFSAQGNQPTGTSWVVTADEDDCDHGESQWGTAHAFFTAGGMVFGNKYSDKESAYFATMAGDKAVAQPWYPPKPGYSLHGLAYCNPALIGVWQKSKGTERLIACGYDPNTLNPLWTAEGLGGSHHVNTVHVTQHALMVPRSKGEYTRSNPSVMVHLDPATGQQLAEYPVEASDCVGVAHHFLVGTSDYFSGGSPVAYDTWNRVRVL